MLASQGRRLTRGYWGNYVAFLVDAQARTRFVVNDPAGSLPCHFTLHRGVQVFFSSLSDCHALKCMRFHVNWPFVRARTVNGIFDVETNPMVEISSVYRGECVQFDERGNCASRRLYWRPTQLAERSERIDDPEFAAAALHATVRSCVHSLAAHHSSVLQQTSGGLDSSIVLGCLGEAPNRPDVTCYTHYVPGSVGDERRWARFATARGKFRHVEVCADPGELKFEELPVLAPSVEPESCFMHWQKGPVERRLADQHRATATFTGEGGDATFCSTTYVFAVDHCMKRHGLGLQTLRTAARVATRRDRTVWNVIGKALHRQLFETGMSACRALLSGTLHLVSAEAMASVSRQKSFSEPLVQQ